MNTTGNRKFGVRMFTAHMPVVLLLAVTLLFPTFASATGDPSGDAKINNMKSDIQACLQKGPAGKTARELFAKKYNVSLQELNKQLAKNSNGNSWDVICAVEHVATLGILWGERAKLDKYHGGNNPYCLDYSKYCDHYNWRQGCLKEKMPSCCGK